MSVGLVGYILLKDKYMGIIQENNEKLTNDAIIRDIREAIEGLDYGTVIIKVHNGKITQIEITQKRRYDDGNWVEKGGGI
jgi:hypothetical protein